jgi:FkbM family methyltransferase
MRPYYYLGNRRGLTMLASGEPFFVNTRDHGISSWIILGGTWETFVDDILSRIVRPGDRVLDAGANQGYYTIRLGTIVGPEGWIFAFEPNPELYELLGTNVDINAYRGRCQIFPQALGARPGTAELSFSYDNMGAGTISPHLAHGAHKVSVEVVRGDDVLPPDTVFDAMKFDVEGFEPEVAEGLAGTIQRSPHAAIVLEVWSPAWRKIGEMADLLARFTLGSKRAFEIGHDGFLELIELDDSQAMATLQDRKDPFYMLLMPEDHWAIDFISSKLRRAIK